MMRCSCRQPCSRCWHLARSSYGDCARRGGSYRQRRSLVVLPPCADFVSALLPTGGADLMTTTSEPTATAVALPLTTFQRIMLRDLLHESWRAHVVNITNLAVRFHTREEPAVAARPAAVRRP